MYYVDGSRLDSNGAKAKNLFRSFPLILILVGLVPLAKYLPAIIEKMSFYFQDVEFGSEYYTLYFATMALFIFTIPVCILNWKKNKMYFWGVLIFAATYPLAIGLSIWLWELLGVVGMAFYLLMFVSIFVIDDSKDEGVGAEGIVFVAIYIIGGAAYVIMRLFGDHLAWLDLGVVALLFFITLCKTFMLVFSNLYMSVPFILSLIFGAGLILQ